MYGIAISLEERNGLSLWCEGDGEREREREGDVGKGERERGRDRGRDIVGAVVWLRPVFLSRC